MSVFRLFGQPILTIFKTGLAAVLALIDCDAGIAQYHAVAVLQIHHDAVFLLLFHIVISNNWPSGPSMFTNSFFKSSVYFAHWSVALMTRTVWMEYFCMHHSVRHIEA